MNSTSRADKTNAYGVGAGSRSRLMPPFLPPSPPPRRRGRREEWGRWRGREGRIEQRGGGGGGGEERRDSVKESSGEKGCVHDNSAS